MDDKGRKNALLQLVFGAFCIGFAPIFVKFVALKGVGLNSIAFWRMGLSAMILFSIVALRRRPLLMPANTIAWAMLAGFFIALDFGVWHRSIIYVGAGMATILGNTQVFATAVFGRLLFKEKLSGRFFAAAATAFVGVIILAGVGSHIRFTQEYVLGIIFGLSVGILYALYLVVLRKVGTSQARPDTLTFIAWVCLFCATLMAAASPFDSGFFLPPDSASWLSLIGLAVVSQVLGWWAIFTAMTNIAASRVGLVLLLQPALATVWGYLFFKEHLTLLQMTGGAITLLCIYYGAKYKVSEKTAKS